MSQVPEEVAIVALGLLLVAVLCDRLRMRRIRRAILEREHPET